MILFLDFDGVLHPVGASVDRLFEHAEMLAAWLREQPGIQLVISSSWREPHRIQELREMLFHADPSLQARVIGVTPLMSRGLGIDIERSVECQAWLQDNGLDQVAWVAIDDDRELFDQALRRDHLVLCDAATGLDRARLSLACQKLRRQKRAEPQRRRYRSANPPIKEIGREEESEIVAALDQARQAEADAATAAVAAAAARRDQWMVLADEQRWATVLLDIDEVLCVNQPFAASSLHKSLTDGLVPDPDFLDALFSPAARQALLHVHEQLNGRVRFVISSSWRERFTREQIAMVFRMTGFEFVADCLHPGSAWRCYTAAFNGDRQMDIEAWLECFHSGEPYVVVDDRHSGGPLMFHRHFDPGEALYGRVVLCQPGVGLSMDHVDDILSALRRPT